MVEVITRKAAKPRIEKQTIGMKKRVLREAYGFADKYFEFKDAVAKIAEEAGRCPNEVWQWAINQFEEEISVVTPEEYTEDEDEADVEE